MRLWAFCKDMNQDGVFTIGDIWLWVQWFFFYPGDWIFKMVIESNSEVATFLEISPALYGGVSSAVISIFVWFVLLFFIVLISEFINPPGDNIEKFFE